MHLKVQLKVTQAEDLIELMNKELASEENISKVSQTALHEGFGLISEEIDLSEEKHMKWLYGLLCILEKPLLPDQAADLNLILNKLLELKS